MKLLNTVTIAGAAALALLASAGAASAQDVAVTANLAVTSDYVFRGFSQTDENPAVQGGFDITKGSFYVGAWASNVDFNDSTDAEVDLYGGYRTEVSGFAVDVGLIGYGYVSSPEGSNYPYLEAKLAVSRAIGPVTAGAAVYYSPDFFGADDKATYVEANLAYSPITNLTLSGAVGEQFLDVSDDYVTWNVGATYAFAGTPLALDVRYSDTDVDTPSIPISDGRVFATLKATF
ncbi:MAG TPA: TorF family putative porin [Brevundimonas sp.]|jgi:uncharacterized protein (TIGR02001 family)